MIVRLTFLLRLLSLPFLSGCFLAELGLDSPCLVLGRFPRPDLLSLLENPPPEALHHQRRLANPRPSLPIRTQRGQPLLLQLFRHRPLMLLLLLPDLRVPLLARCVCAQLRFHLPCRVLRRFFLSPLLLPSVGLLPAALHHQYRRLEPCLRGVLHAQRRQSHLLHLPFARPLLLSPFGSASPCGLGLRLVGQRLMLRSLVCIPRPFRPHLGQVVAEPFVPAATRRHRPAGPLRLRVECRVAPPALSLGLLGCRFCRGLRLQRRRVHRVRPGRRAGRARFDRRRRAPFEQRVAVLRLETRAVWAQLPADLGDVSRCPGCA